MLLRRPLHRSRNLFTDNMPHAAHQKPCIADAQYDGLSVYFCLADADAFLQPCFFLRSRNFFIILRKIQRIFKFRYVKPGRKAFFVRHHFDPVGSTDPEITAALITDVFIDNNLCFDQFLFADRTYDHIRSRLRFLHIDKFLPFQDWRHCLFPISNCKCQFCRCCNFSIHLRSSSSDSDRSFFFDDFKL